MAQHQKCDYSETPENDCPKFRTLVWHHITNINASLKNSNLKFGVKPISYYTSSNFRQK